MAKNLSARARTGDSHSSATYSLINRPGVFLEIPVETLHVDTEYQRPVNGNRIDKMAKDWSWIACGCISVALRGPNSGEYYVIDGQHRMEAAIRAEVKVLPCLVFESLNHTDEAQGFLDMNLARKAMSVVDRYRALLVVGDPTAIKVKELLETAGRVPRTGVARNSPNQGQMVNCLEFLLNAVSRDEETITKIWPLVLIICEGRLLTKKICQGLFYLERFIVNSSILDRHWSRRLLQVGYDKLTKSIDEACAYEGHGGAAICAQGILRAVNQGLRNKLRIEVKQTPSESEE